jgi:hypothetical protein
MKVVEIEGVDPAEVERILKPQASARGPRG